MKKEKVSRLGTLGQESKQNKKIKGNKVKSRKRRSQEREREDFVLLA